jgi:UDP-2,4-diacetamido-2,4,6-trideoxy-beta-L-altropyranose hydrolase
MKVIVRTDSSVQIGTGHVVRCLTLAKSLQDRGAKVWFISRELKGNLFRMIREAGINLVVLPPASEINGELAGNRHAHWLEVRQEQDSDETLRAILEIGEVNWLVVDHYGLDKRWESQLRPHVEKLFVIDDLADRPHDCDLLLDQNLHEGMEVRYSVLLPENCRQLLGPNFALLRPEFLAARNYPRKRDGSIRRILIFYGAFDSTNETAKALEALKRLNVPGIAADVVVGQANPYQENIKATCQKVPNVSFHCQVTNMGHLMARADLALGAGGTVTWERCCLGLPALVTTVASNQEELALSCAKMGVLFLLGKSSDVSAFDMEIALRTFLRFPEALVAFSQNGMKLVDGRGSSRVAGWLSPPHIILRPAKMEDCDAIYRWRNSEETRRHIFHPDSIPLDSHIRWFRKSLEDTNRVLLIGETAGEPVGVLRYDMQGSEALISVYLVPGTHGHGTGTHLIRSGSSWLRKNYPQIRSIKAEVMPTNISSRKAFINAGYEENVITFKEDFSK